MTDTRDPKDFIRSQTVLLAPPLTPEIQLYLATEITPIWQATEETLATGNIPPPYWAFAWPGGQALTRYLLDNPGWVKERRVLDFAAGSGLTAIGVAKAGAAMIEAAEIDAFAIAAIELNAAANDVVIKVIQDDVIGHGLAEEAGRWDVVLAGDVCYEKPMAERVIAWFRQLATRGVTILMGDPGRAYLPGNGLVEVARYRVPTSLELEDRMERETIVWRLMP
ncbi:MAG TPA: methyltransferase [Dongiaceae bacterium]